MVVYIELKLWHEFHLKNYEINVIRPGIREHLTTYVGEDDITYECECSQDRPKRTYKKR